MKLQRALNELNSVVKEGFYLVQVLGNEFILSFKEANSFAITSVKKFIDKQSLYVYMCNIRAEHTKSQRAHYELYLRKDIECLTLAYDIPGGTYVYIGYINPSKELHMLSTTNHKTNYSIWLNNGMKFDRTEIEYKGRIYWISRRLELMSSNLKGNGIAAYIYDLERAMPCPNCNDPNVKCYPNDTPMLY